MSERNPLSPFRLRRFALQLRQFTVNDLKSIADVSSETLYSFLHDLKKQDEGLFDTASLPSEGPGRPILRYILTRKGIDFLAEQNVGLAKELNEFAFREQPALRPSLPPGEHPEADSNDSIWTSSLERADQQQIDALSERRTQYE
jgi:DNA-binding PadR family transcriptional regulator